MYYVNNEEDSKKARRALRRFKDRLEHLDLERESLVEVIKSIESELSDYNTHTGSKS
jgi:predicted  nucleic acid-binding Zn-ribbon protein